MTTTTEHWDLISGIAYEVANRFASRGRKYGAEGDDFYQEFWLWSAGKSDLIAEKAEELDERGFERFIGRCLENEARDYLRDIKSQALGYHRDDEYFFSRGEMTYLLESVFDPEAWLNPPQSEGRSTKAPAEGNNWVTTLADVRAGFDKLGAEDQVLLRAFHEEGHPNNEVADALGITESACSYRHHRAIKRLVEHLGGEKPRPERPGDQYDPWRGRHAIPNRQARAMTDNYYEEG